MGGKEMGNEADHSHWQDQPPWIVFDPDEMKEWVIPQTLRYYVANVDGRWFICDRFTDLAVPDTESDSRFEAIRRFHEAHKRMSGGGRIPNAVKGTVHRCP